MGSARGNATHEVEASVIGRSTAAAFAGVALLLACEACSSATPPLASRMVNGNKICVEAPNTTKASGVPTWNTPVGFAFNWYDNMSSAPVEIKSVSLISPHNLILHGALTYRGTLGNPNTSGNAWKLMYKGATPSEWKHRQTVPGAVISPLTSREASLKSYAPAYSMILDVSAKTPAGGYALGQQVKYEQGGNQYTLRSYTGYAVAPPAPRGGPNCEAFENDISAAWKPISASWNQHS